MPRQPFHFNGTDHDLSHVDSKTVIFAVPAHKNLPARQFMVFLEYSGDHCFTEDEKAGHDQALYYCTENHGGKKFKRMFNLKRWEFSRQLPTIIEDLLDRWVYFTNGQNFHLMNLVDASGLTVQYLIFFQVKQKDKGLRLVIESAYPYDPALGVHFQEMITAHGLALFYARCLTANHCANLHTRGTNGRCPTYAGHLLVENHKPYNLVIPACPEPELLQARLERFNRVATVVLGTYPSAIMLVDVALFVNANLHDI